MLFSKASAYLAGIFITTALLCGFLHTVATHLLPHQNLFHDPQLLVPLGWLSAMLAALLGMVSLIGWSLGRLRINRLAGE